MPEEQKYRGLIDVDELEKVPCHERIAAKSTYEIIARGAQLNPSAVAIHFLMSGEAYDKPISITYAQLLGRLHQTANMFHALGIGPTDVVTYLLPNLPQTHFILWGAEAAGIANPINPLLEAETIRDICLAAGTKVLVALGDMPGADIWPKVEAIRERIPSLKAVIRVMGPSDPDKGIYGYDDLVAKYPADRLDFDRVIDRDDIASLYHTGGTTGRPKLARRTHYNEVVLAWDIAVGTGLQPGEAVMCGLPLFHCNGTCVTGLMPFSVGGQVVLLSPRGYRDPKIMVNFYRIVDKYRPVFFSCVPTVLGALLDIPKGDADISSLRYVLCGAAPLSVELFNRFEAFTGMKIIEGYGMTETACASAVNPKDGARKVGSIGVRLPYHWMRIVILDENGKYLREAKPGEIGVLCVNGPCVFKGYVEDIHNQGIWVEEDWFNTGDLARQDEDGYLWLTGRRKELIIRGGHNIDPAQIEEALYKMRGVKTAAAVGRPDAHAGEVPVAYVELSDPTIHPDQLMDWAKANIGERAAVPKEIVVINQVPLTAVGKIFKPALRWDAIKRTYEEELAGLGDLVESVQVTVSEHMVHGTNAVIHIKARAGADPATIQKKVPEILARYTVHYDVFVD